MPEYTWKLKLLEPQNTVKAIIENEFSIEGHAKLVGDIVSQNYWKPGMNILFDDRKVEFVGTNLDLIRKVSENFQSYKEKLGDGKTAILMESLSDYARGRQFELLTEDKVYTQIKVFRDEKEALNWLTSQ